MSANPDPVYFTGADHDPISLDVGRPPDIVCSTFRSLDFLAFGSISLPHNVAFIGYVSCPTLEFSSLEGTLNVEKAMNEQITEMDEKSAPSRSAATFGWAAF